MKLNRIVVVGDSIAALTAVDALRVEGFEGSITVLSDEKVPPYTRVPLSKRVLAGLESEDNLTLIAEGDVKLVGGKTPNGARIASDEVLEADIVVSAVGDLPNVEWLLGSGLRLGGEIHVDAWCRVRANIVAAGDVAVHARPDGSSRRTPRWTNAVEQARAAAQALLRAENAAPFRPSHYYWTEQFGLDVKMVEPPGSDGTPTISKGSLGSPPAFLEWRTSGTAYRVVAATVGAQAPVLRSGTQPVRECSACSRGQPP